MSGSHPRSQDTGHQVEAMACSDVDRVDLLIEPQAVDSLDEFPPESLELYPPPRIEQHEDASGLLAFLPATPSDATAAAPQGPSRVWQRRRSRLRKMSAVVGRHRIRVVAAVSQLTAHVRIRAAAARSAVHAGVASVAGRTAAAFRRLDQIDGSTPRRDIPSQQDAGLRPQVPDPRPQDPGPRSQVPGPTPQLRTHGGRPRKVAEPALGTGLSLARERRRERIRRAITGAAGRDSVAATVTQLTPVVARRVAASSASLVLRLRRALPPLAAGGRAFVGGVQAQAISFAHRAGRALGTSLALVRGIIAATVVPKLAAASARLARQSRLATRSIAVSASSLAVRVHTATTRAVTALGPAVRMLHPRSVLAAAAMLALIVVAGPPNSLSDMMSAGVAVPPADPAATSITSIEPILRSPILVALRAPLEDTRPARTLATAAAAPTAPVALAEHAATRIDPRAIQGVLNRYRDALSTLDVSGVRAVWPNADVDALRKQFAGVRDQNVEFEACRISSVASGARASCAGVIESGFRAGDRRPRVERRRWQFELRRFGASWRITDVQTDRG